MSFGKIGFGGEPNQEYELVPGVSVVSSTNLINTVGGVESYPGPGLNRFYSVSAFPSKEILDCITRLNSDQNINLENTNYLFFNIVAEILRATQKNRDFIPFTVIIPFQNNRGILQAHIINIGSNQCYLIKPDVRQVETLLPNSINRLKRTFRGDYEVPNKDIFFQTVDIKEGSKIFVFTNPQFISLMNPQNPHGPMANYNYEQRLSKFIRSCNTDEYPGSFLGISSTQLRKEKQKSKYNLSENEKEKKINEARSIEELLGYLNIICPFEYNDQSYDSTDIRGLISYYSENPSAISKLFDYVPNYLNLASKIYDLILQKSQIYNLKPENMEYIRGQLITARDMNTFLRLIREIYNAKIVLVNKEDDRVYSLEELEDLIKEIFNSKLTPEDRSNLIKLFPNSQLDIRYHLERVASKKRRFGFF